MTDDTPTPPSPPAPSNPSGTASPPAEPAAAAEPATLGPTINIGREYGTGTKNLPPARIVLIVLGVIVVITAVTSLLQRPHSAATGEASDVVAVEIPNQSAVMVAVNVTIDNHGEKPFWVHTIEAAVETDAGNFTDEAASGVDFERYFQGFPALKEHALQPLKREAMVGPGGKFQGTILVSFPVTLDAFSKRKSLSVTVHPYDQPVPLVLKAK